MAMNDTKPVAPLAEYLNDVQYLKWQTDRADLETKWEQNDCTIRRIRQENWKEGEGEDWRSNNSIGLVKQKLLTAVALVCAGDGRRRIRSSLPHTTAPEPSG